MKRGAEKQITREQGSDDEESQENPEGGFKLADESTLARRPMRGLPKRATGAAPTPAVPVNGTSTSNTPSVPSFGGFSGFSSSSSSDFSFKPPTSKGTETTPSSSSFFSSPSLAFPSNPPPVNATASSTAKTFASFLSTPAKPPAADVEMSQPSTTTPANDPALNYYTSLRGLNVSFLSAATKAIDEDPFFDTATMLTQYKNLRSDIQKEFDNTKPSTAPAKTEPAAKPTAMPAAPASFSGFNTLSSTSSSTPASGGFTPKLPASTSNNETGFSFPSTTSSASPSTSLFSGFGSQSTATQKQTPTSSSFSFSKPPETKTSEATPAQDAPAPSITTNPFGASSSTFSGPLFGGASKSVFGKPDTSSTFTGTPLFGSSSSNPFGKTDTPSTSASTGNPLFGGSSSNLFGKPDTLSTSAGNPLFGSSSSNPFGVSESSSSSTFGGPAASSGLFGSTAPPKSTGFTFARPASGSIGNPVGFGFGSPSSTPDAASAKSPGFSFAQPVEKKTESEGEEAKADDGAEGSTGEKTEGKPEKVGGLTMSNPHDEEGEGEEDEETVHVIRVKAHRLKKEGEKGGSGWAELGVGMLRLKKHKETGSRRMLMRNSANGKININFRIYSGLKPSQNKKTLTFIGHDETGTSQTYNVRTSTEDQMNELKDAMDREIAFVKAKEDS